MVNGASRFALRQLWESRGRAECEREVVYTEAVRRSLSLLAFTSACAGGVSPQPTPVAFTAKPPATRPTARPPPHARRPTKVVDDVRVRASLAADDPEGLVLAEMIFGERRAWLLFEPSGDDLYARYAEFGKGVSKSLCRANVAFLTFGNRGAFERLQPHVEVDIGACSTEQRNVLTVAEGEAPKGIWITIAHDPKGSAPGWYALWDSYGLGTELWVWRLVPARADTPDKELFGGEVYVADTERYEIDALSAGVPPMLETAE